MEVPIFSPTRADPRLTSWGIYISKDERLQLKFHNWKNDIGYRVIVRYIDKNGIERYLDKTGVTNRNFNITYDFMDLEEGWLTHIAVYAGRYPGALARAMLVVISLVRGSGAWGYDTVVLTYGTATWSTPLIWPMQEGVEYDHESILDYDTYAEPGATEVTFTRDHVFGSRYAFFEIGLGSATGDRTIVAEVLYGAQIRNRAYFTVSGANTQWCVILGYDGEPGVVGRTVYVRLPEMRFMIENTELKLRIANPSTGDSILRYHIKYTPFPGRMIR
ncbi:MAG: hypothetical protein NZ992_00715 [Candidatus Korarchaeum sp.]|nr:hypothetical protein [Candidatus Korarchaeum sp.]MDW8035518.1 hypothetical protein [Candidatus Korarchaeum sp.]